ncbi:flagellin N-terminal helical domain-containing protein, partial [Salmonella enterica]
QRVRELAVQSANSTNSQSDLDSIQAEITQRLNEIDRVSGQTQFNGVKVLAQDNTLTIQVGANDGETIDIDLKQINSQTLGLDTLNVQKAYDVSATDAMDPKSFTDGTKNLTAPDATAIKAALGNPTATGDSLSATLSFKDGKYYATVAGYTNAADTSKNGKYEVNVDSATGAVTFNAAPTKATVTGDTTV